MSHLPPPRRRSGLPRDPRTPGLLKTVNNKSRENVKPAKAVMPAAEMTEAQVCELPQDDSDEVSEPDMPSKSQDEAPGDTQEERSSSQGKSPKVVPKPTDDPDSDADYAARKEKTDVRQTYFGTSKSGREQERNFRASQETGSGPKFFGGSQGSNSQLRGSKRSSPDTASPGPESKRGRTGRLDDGKDTAKLLKLSQTSSQRKGYGKKDKEKARIEEKRKERKREKEEAKKGSSMPP